MSFSLIETLREGEKGSDAQYLAVTAMAAYIIESQGVRLPRSKRGTNLFDIAMQRQSQHNRLFTHYDEAKSETCLITEATKMAAKVALRDYEIDVLAIPERFYDLSADVFDQISPLYENAEEQSPSSPTLECM